MDGNPATVVLLAGVGCGDSPEEIDPDKGGTEQEGPESPNPRNLNPHRHSCLCSPRPKP